MRDSRQQGWRLYLNRIQGLNLLRICLLVLLLDLHLLAAFAFLIAGYPIDIPAKRIAAIKIAIVPDVCFENIVYKFIL